MVEVGAVSFRASIDTSGIRAEVARINDVLSRQRLKLRLELDTTGLRTEIARVSQSLRDSDRGIKIKVQLDTAGLRSQVAAISRELQNTQVRLPVAPTAGRTSGGGSSPIGDSQAREAAALSREFDKTAAAVEKLVNRAAQLDIRRQEQQAAALARELQQAERAAAQAAAQAQRISFSRQQQEIAAFAREFDRAAAAQQRLQQQAASDRQVLGGARFSDREIKNVEAAIARVRAETQKTDQVAALLRQKYGLADAEARKLAGTLADVGSQSRQVDGITASFLGNLKANAAQAALSAIAQAFQAIAGAAANAVQTSLQYAQQTLQVEAALGSVFDSQAEVAEQLEFVRGVADNVGGNFRDLSLEYSRFVAAGKLAGVGVEDLQNVFAETTRVAGTFGATAADQNLILNALSQIASKGVVSMEELRQQLGERLPVAFAALADGLGISQARLNALVSSGELTAREFFPAFAKGLQNIGGEINPLTQALGQLDNQVDATFEAFGAAILPAQEAFLGLASAILTEAGKGFAGFSQLTEASQRLQTVLSGNPEIAERLGEALATVANEGVKQIAEIIDAITAFAGNEAAIDGVANAIENLRGGIILLGDFAQGVIGILEAIASLTPAAGDADTAFGVIGDAIESSVQRIATFSPQLAVTIATLERIITLAQNAKAAVNGATTFEGAPPQGLGQSLTAANNAAIAAVSSVPIGGAGGGPGPDERNYEKELKALEDAQDKTLTAIETRELESRRRIVAAGGGQDEIAEVERKALEERVAAQVQFLEQLKTLRQADLSEKEAQKVDEQIANVEKAIASDRLKIEEGLQDARVNAAKNAADEIKNANTTALAEIEQRSVNAQLAIVEGGGSPEEQQRAQAENERQVLQERIAQRQSFVEELRELQGREGLTPDEVAELGNQILQTETAIANDRLELARATEAERQRILEESINNQLEALRLGSEERLAAIEREQTGLQNQQSLSGAQQSTRDAASTLDTERLDLEKAQALATGNVARARQIDAEQSAIARRNVAAQLADKQQELAVERRLAQLAAQRQAEIANTAVEEARLNLEKAKGLNASQAEISNLERTLQLRQAAAADAQQGVQVTEQVFDSRGQELAIQAEIDLENLRQSELEKAKDIVAEELRLRERALATAEALEEAERSRASALISALSAQQQSTEESLAQLDAIRSRFREAQQGGLFAGLGGEFNQAASQLQGILASGGQLGQLIQFAQDTDSQIAQQLLGGVGRGDVLQLVEADRQAEDVQRAQEEAAAAREAADQILIAEIRNAGEPLLAAFQQGGAEAAGLIQQALASIGAPAQSLRAGGVTEGGITQVHADEFAVFPRGTRIMSQAESRRLVAEHLGQRSPITAPTLSVPDLVPASAARAIPGLLPTAQQLSTKSLEKRFDELIRLVEEAKTRKDGGQTNYFQAASQSEASRMAAELRRLSRRSPGGFF